MDISTEVAAIQAASQGSELRQPLVGALNKLNSGSLPAVIASDAGKILKVGANGWEVGEKSGYMPVPTDTMQITDNGTYDVTNYASASVNIPQPSGTKQITENGTYNVIDYASAVVNVSGSGGSTSILSGTNSPVSNAGQNGDIYLQYSGDFIKTGVGQVFDTEYAPSPNTKIKAVFKITNAQTSTWPQLFGVRNSPSSDAGSFMFTFASSQGNYTNAMSTFGSTKTTLSNFGANNLIDKLISVEITPNKTTFDINGIKTVFNLNNAGQFSCQSHLCIFGLIAGGAFQSWSTLDNVELYNFQIFESDILVHDYIPFTDLSDIVCLHDNVSSNNLYVNNGNIQKGTGGEILAAFAKVSGLWQPLIGTNISDISA